MRYRSRCTKTQTVTPNATMPAVAQPVNIGKTGSMQFFMVAQNQAVVPVAGAEFKVTGPGANLRRSR